MAEKRGGKRKGAGRPSKADELRVSGFAISAIENVYGSEEEFWQFIASQSKKSFPHLVKMLEYGYGKPLEITKNETNQQVETPKLEVIIKK